MKLRESKIHFNHLSLVCRPSCFTHKYFIYFQGIPMWFSQTEARKKKEGTGGIETIVKTRKETDKTRGTKMHVWCNYTS